jgi:hypothetical protein
MRDVITRTKSDIGYTHPIIGMHVRHGDSCTSRVDCHSLTKYMQEASDLLRNSVTAASDDLLIQAEKIRLKYGISTVFLATDSEQVVAEAKKHVQFTVRNV